MLNVLRHRGDNRYIDEDEFSRMETQDGAVPWVEGDLRYRSERERLRSSSVGEFRERLSF